MCYLFKFVSGQVWFCFFPPSLLEILTNCLSLSLCNKPFRNGNDKFHGTRHTRDLSFFHYQRNDHHEEEIWQWYCHCSILAPNSNIHTKQQSQEMCFVLNLCYSWRKSLAAESNFSRNCQTRKNRFQNFGILVTPKFSVENFLWKGRQWLFCPYKLDTLLQLLSCCLEVVYARAELHAQLPTWEYRLPDIDHRISPLLSRYWWSHQWSMMCAFRDLHKTGCDRRYPFTSKLYHLGFNLLELSHNSHPSSLSFFFNFFLRA